MIALGLVMAVAGGGCFAADPQAVARSDLEGLLGAAPSVDGFAFDHAAGGTRVADCFLPNQRFSGTLDQSRNTLVISDDTKPVVVVTGRTTLVHSSLFASGAAPAEWLRIDSEPSEPVREAVARALGAELAGYALVDGLPPSGNETAMATLAAASKVKRLPNAKLGGETVERFQLTVPREELNDGSSPPGSNPSSLRDAVVEVWVTSGGYVARVEVRPAPSDGAGEEEEDPGWAVAYRPLDAPPAPPDTSGAAPIGSVDPATLTAPREPGCEVPL